MTGNIAKNNSMNGFTFNENSYASVFSGNTATGNTLNHFDGVSETSTEGIVTVDYLNIGQHGSKNGGDCDSVGTWVPTDLGPEGGTCTLSTDIQITGIGIGTPNRTPVILPTKEPTTANIVPLRLPPAFRVPMALVASSNNSPRPANTAMLATTTQPNA